MKDHKLVTRTVYLDIDGATPQELIDTLQEIANTHSDLKNLKFTVTHDDPYGDDICIEGYRPMTELELKRQQVLKDKMAARATKVAQDKKEQEIKELKRLHKKIVGKEIEL